MYVYHGIVNRKMQMNTGFDGYLPPAKSEHETNQYMAALPKFGSISGPRPPHVRTSQGNCV